jgi:hypothetical protein
MVGEQRFEDEENRRRRAHMASGKWEGEGDVVEGQGRACDWAEADPAAQWRQRGGTGTLGQATKAAMALSTGAVNCWSASS